MNAPQKNIRRKLRYAADPLQHAVIELDPQGEEFSPDFSAVICNESYIGCCVVAIKQKHLVQGTKIRIKVGQLAPMFGEVKWVTELDVEVVKVGVEFLE